MTELNDLQRANARIAYLESRAEEHAQELGAVRRGIAAAEEQKDLAERRAEKLEKLLMTARAAGSAMAERVQVLEDALAKGL